MALAPDKLNAPKPRPKALHWLGVFFLVLGVTLAGAFSARQLMESGTGHTYYEFIAGGAVLAIVGIGVTVIARRK